MQIINQSRNQQQPLYKFEAPDSNLLVEDFNVFSKSELTTLIKQFAPILCFHANEAHQPVNVEWYLKHANIINKSTKSKVSFEALPTMLGEEKNDEDYLELKVSAEKNNHRETAQPIVYVRAKSFEHEYTDLQYWFLFRGKGSNGCNLKWLVEGIIGHNGSINLNPIGCQGGHWERITIRINNKSRLAEKVFLPNVKGGEWIPFDKMQTKNNQIITFVSKNNHSFYQSAGIKPIETIQLKLVSSVLEFSLFDECAIESILDSSHSFELISSDNIANEENIEPNWLNFKGKWGNPQLQNINTSSVHNTLKGAFGTDLVFLLGNNVLNELSAFLIDFHSNVCKCKALGPKNKKCWNGKEED